MTSSITNGKVRRAGKSVEKLEMFTANADRLNAVLKKIRKSPSFGKFPAGEKQVLEGLIARISRPVAPAAAQKK